MKRHLGAVRAGSSEGAEPKEPNCLKRTGPPITTVKLQ